MEHRQKQRYNLDKIKYNPALYQINVKDLNNWMDSLLSSNAGTLSSNESYKLVAKNGKKKVFNVSYNIEMNAKYKNLFYLIGKFDDHEKKMINRILTLKFKKIDVNLLKISLNFEAVAYEDN